MYGAEVVELGVALTTFRTEEYTCRMALPNTPDVRVLLTEAKEASGHYRIRQPAEAVNRLQQGVECRVMRNGLPMVFSPIDGRYMGLADDFPDADVLVLQRPMMWFMSQVIRDVQKRGIRVIIELDDDFHTAHPDNLGFQLNHPKRSPYQNWNHLSKSIQAADWVCVSTPALQARYGSHGRCSVIRNSIDADLLDIPHTYDGQRIGWPGTAMNHPTDPQATRGAVARFLDEHPDWSFLCIGGADFEAEVRRGFELRPHHNVSLTPFRQLMIHHRLMSMLDIGIVPLALTKFNEAKSALKGMEMAALGIPFVASRTPEYERLNFGWTAMSKGKYWLSLLKYLAGAPPAIHADLSAELRDKIRQHHTINVNAWRWAQLWHDLARHNPRRPVHV